MSNISASINALNVVVPDLTLTEYLNVPKAKALLQNPSVLLKKDDLKKLKDWVASFTETTEDPDTKKRTQLYKTKEYSTGIQFGRDFPTDYGVAKMWNAVRSELYDGIEFDVDQVSAQPRILLSICKLNTIACPCVQDYCDNRESYFLSIPMEQSFVDNYNKMKSDNKTIRDMRKHALNMMFFGAGEDAIKAYIGKNIFLKNNKLYELRKELRGYGSKIGVQQTICNLPQYRDLKMVYSASKEAKESPQGIIAIILQTHEREINRETIEMFESSGFTVTVSQFDGFQVRTQDRNSVLELIAEISSEWKERGWFVDYIIKEFGMKLSLLEVPTETITNNEAIEKFQSYNLSTDCITALEDINESCTHKTISICLTTIFRHKNVGIVFNNSFYIFCEKLNKHIWIEDTGEKNIYMLVQTSLMYIEDYFHMLNAQNNGIDAEIVKSAQKVLHNVRLNFGNLQNLKSIITFLEKHYYVNDIAQMFNQNPLLIAFPNGVLEIIPTESTTKFRDGNMTDYLTIAMNYNYVDPENEPDNANDILAKLSDLLNSIHPVLEDYNYELKTGSWAIYGKPQAILWKVGNGANGKSILERMYSETFGKYSVKVSSSIFTSEPKAEGTSNHLYALRNARMIYTNEPRGNRFTIVKQNFLDICDQSKVSCRSNHRDQYEFKPQYFLACSCNSIPPIPDIDQAVIRRWKCISYTQKFVTDYDDSNPETNTQKQRLEQDIFTDLEGYQPYFFNLLLEHIFAKEVVPESSKALLKELIADQNPYADWFNQCVSLTTEKVNVSKTDLWQSYCKYTVENSDKLACSVNKFAKEMERHFKMQNKKTNTGLVFVNIKLNLILQHNESVNCLC